MRLLIFVTFAVIASVSANCGCLKCSKHLTVAGEVPGAAGYRPIKVIYRTDGGAPPRGYGPGGAPGFGQGGASGYGPGYGGALGCTVQKPLVVPQAVTQSFGSEHNCEIRQFYRPNSGDYCDSRRFVHPITVQAPVPLPKGPVTDYIPLTGLKANIDRVVLPGPAFPRPYGSNLGPARPLLEPINGDNPIFHSRDSNSYGSSDSYGSGSCGYSNYGTCNSCGGCQRYENQDCQLSDAFHQRTKRQLPFLDHGYKFMVNMLPPFIQEPIKHSVNIMAMTHPDKKLKNYYAQPPKQTLQEKLAEHHKKNVAMLKEKLFGASPAPPKKTYHSRRTIGDELIRKEAVHFLNTLNDPVDERKHSWSPRMTQRNGDHADHRWLNEMRSEDVLEEEDEPMSEHRKAMLLLKLKKLNAGSDLRFRRDIDEQAKHRGKRSVVIDSEEFELPLYQITLKDSNELEEDDSKFEDSAEYSREAMVGRSRKQLYENSMEEMMRRAIKAELRKFKKEKESEEVVSSPFKPNNMAPHSPILHLLTFPMKLLGGLNGMQQQSLIGSMPKMIIGTKKYFREFGRNFKKNALHFASDVLGDFDHHGPTNDILGALMKPRRYRRSLDEKDLHMNLEQYEPEYSLDYPAETSQNFHNATNSKVRKKRYIVRMVDDDEVEEIVRAKLGKMFDEFEESYKPMRKAPRKRKYVEDDYSEERPRKAYQRRRKYDSSESEEDFRKKVVVEKLRPKIIIDNNGLPFMELNGYKRPLFIRKMGNKRKKSHSAEVHTNLNYGSSEEADMQRIHSLIHDAQNDEEMLQATNTNNVPLQTLKEKLSLLLYETDVLVHMMFEKYDEIYDDMIELQYIKNSIVQDWKRLVMQKKINERDCKIALLEKFKEMQRIKEITMINIVNALYIDSENRFVVKELTKMMVGLQKFQCIINQVVECFQEHFKMGTKFDMAKEIKFVDYLSSINFVKAKTRNDLIQILKDDRDRQLQENILQLDKLKKLLVEEDSGAIQEEANMLWEMKNIEQMQKDNIEEMYQKTDCGQKIRKNLKILFDLSKRLHTLEEKEKRFHNTKQESSESEEEVEVSIEDKKSIKIKHPVKNFDLEDFKKKWQDKVEKQKMLFQKNMKKNLYKLKKSGSSDSEE